MPATSPPMAPAQVFFGDTAGHSLGPPKARPMKKAPLSVPQTTAKTKSTAATPWSGASLNSSTPRPNIAA